MPATTDRRCLIAAVSAVLLSLGGGFLLVLAADASPLTRSAALSAGVALVAAAAVSILRRRPAVFGPADAVTLLRTILAGAAAAIIILSTADDLPIRSWGLFAVAVPALLLDAVDGLVARRTSTVSGAGARFDMEVDSALFLILSIPVAVTVGAWALLIGLMRYLFAAAAWLRPPLRRPLSFSQFRRIVAGLQAAALGVALAPLVPVPVATWVVGSALTLLVISFGRDVLWLERAAKAVSAAP